MPDHLLCLEGFNAVPGFRPLLFALHVHQRLHFVERGGLLLTLQQNIDAGNVTHRFNDGAFVRQIPFERFCPRHRQVERANGIDNQRRARPKEDGGSIRVGERSNIDRDHEDLDNRIPQAQSQENQHRHRTDGDVRAIPGGTPKGQGRHEAHNG